MEDDKMIVSFDVIFLYKNIPVNDTLNIIKNSVNNGDQFTKKKPIPKGKLSFLI